MATRSVGAAVVRFGMVAAPVKVYAAVESEAEVSFNMLHRKCGSRVKQQKVCPKDDCSPLLGGRIENDEIAKGYEFEKDRFVMFTPEEIAALDAEPTKAIDIGEFVPVDAVDLSYYDTPYYLGPDKGGGRAFWLLSRAMIAEHLLGIAQYAVRGKEYLVALRGTEEGITMHRLRYADQIRSAAALDLGAPLIEAGELKMARQLVVRETVEAFDPEGYEDTVRKRVVEKIAQRVKTGEAIASNGKGEAPTSVVDIMESLRASLAAPKARRVRAIKPEPKKEEPKRRAAGGRR